MYVKYKNNPINRYGDINILKNQNVTDGRTEEKNGRKSEPLSLHHYRGSTKIPNEGHVCKTNWYHSVVEITHF